MLVDTETTLVGEVTDIFAHRFVIKTEQKTVLADLGPEGTEKVLLRKGDQVEVSGEMKPSELKVTRIVKAGEEPVILRGPKHHHGPGRNGLHRPKDVDASSALQRVKENGLTPMSKPVWKPKHFEILTQDTNGSLFEVHLELDGEVRKKKPVRDDDPKWAAERYR